jgi:hypothetical protein
MESGNMNEISTLLMAGQTRAVLQAKLRQPTEPLATYWQHLQLLARQNPFWFSSCNVLAFVVTGEEVYRRPARDLFLRFTKTKDAGLLTKEVQYHTHTASAPLGRLMALYDWIADTELLTPAEDAAFRAAALDFAAQVPMRQLQGRARMFDNQIFSNAFGAAVTGHVLGVRRGDSAQARRIHAVGMEWLLDQFGRLPHGCYSGEGSTYHMLVVMPLLTLAGAFVEETAGIPLFHRGQAPSLSPLRDWLIMARDLVGPAGLLPGWDAYGAYPFAVRSPLAYLAQRDGDREALALIRDAHTWYPSSHIAWEFDDRLWTLVWWPEKLEPAPACPFHAWMKSATAGALQDARTRTRLFQYWDPCGGAPHNGRCNVNPNAIDLQSRGLPLLLDGAPTLPAGLLNLDETALRHYLPEGLVQGLRRYLGQPETPGGLTLTLRHAVAGGIGDSNSLVVDGENWYVPLRSVGGQGLALHDAGRLQVIESDSADYYRDRYDVTKVTRISALVDGEIVLCLDDWVSETPHRLTWQAFTWPEAAQADGRVRADIGGLLQLDFLPGQNGQWALTPVAGFPKAPCNASTRVEFQLPKPTAAARLLMGMVIQSQLDEGEDLSAGWTFEASGESRSGVNLSAFYLEDEWPSGAGFLFRRRFSLADAAAQPLCLRIPTATLSLRVSVNGVSVAPRYPQTDSELEGKTSDYAQMFDIGPACRIGENEVELRVASFHGESLCGPVTLHRPQPVAPVALSAVGKDQWLVQVGGRQHRVLLGNREMVAWGGGHTDARHALLSADGELALAGVCRTEFPDSGITVKSNLPVDLSVSAGALRFGLLPANAHVIVRLPGGVVVVNAGCVLQVASSVPGLKLSFRMDETRDCFVNGQAMGRRGGPGDRLVDWSVPVASACGTAALQTAEEVYRMADRLPIDLEKRLDECLKSGDWRLQLAAADVAGQFDVQSAVPALLRLLEEEAAKPPHPGLSRSWSESKMNQALMADADHSPDTTIDPVEGAKRYRLTQALVIALGRLGDARAVAPLERIMARGTDFFPALAQVPVALARLGNPGSIAVLQRHKDYGEINVQTHVRLALDLLNGEISGIEFETRVNPA